MLDVDDLDELEADDDFDFDAAWQAVEPDDPLTLIYTSGTTGDPKGVVLTHKSMLFTMRAYDEVLHYERGGRVISYLPMAHIAERNCSHYFPMQFGFTVTCCPDPREVMSYFPEVRPSWFFAVPRIFEKLKAAIESGPDEEPAAIRERLGMDQLSALNVGAAPCPPEVIEFFHSIGLPLGELWGMSETNAIGACNPPENVKIGTVGPPVPGVEIRLADDGEVELRGDCVFAGYYGQEEQTRETFTDDGWLKTGDVGELDDDGYLSIVDRKKELIINAAGKNMSPSNIESTLKAAGPLIGSAVVIGDRRPVQRRADRPRPRRRRRVRRLARRRDRRGGRDRERPPLQGRADQAPHRARAGVGARRRRAHADHEAQAQADRREVRGRDRGAVWLSRSGARCSTRPTSASPGPVEAGAHSDLFGDLVTLQIKLARRAQSEVERRSRRLLHAVNLPTATDVRRLSEQVASLQRQLREFEDRQR